MSVQALAWAIEGAPDVPTHAVAVLVALANSADEYGRDAYPSVARLAWATRKSARQVQRALDELEELQLIRPGDQRAAYRLRSDRRPTVWDLRMDRRRPPFGDAARTGRGDTSVTPRTSRDDAHVTPQTPRGDAHDMSSTSRGDADDTSWASRGDIHDANGVTYTSPEPSIDPSTQVGRELTAPREDDQHTPHPDSRVEATTPRTTVDHGRGAPPERCPAHLDTPAPGPCGPCGDARRAHTAWRDRLAATQAAARAQVAAEAAAARDADRHAIAACPRCDDRGQTEHGVRCPHTGDTTTLPPGRAAFLAERRRLADRATTPTPPATTQPDPAPTAPQPTSSATNDDHEHDHPEDGHQPPTAWSADDPPF